MAKLIPRKPKVNPLTQQSIFAIRSEDQDLTVDMTVLHEYIYILLLHILNYLYYLCFDVHN